jgi:hypothetical protein
MKTKLLWLALLTTILVSVYLTSLLLDAGISLDGARSHGQRTQARSELALTFLAEKWVGASKEDLLNSAKKLPENVIIKEHNEIVEIGDIKFEISNDKISSIDYID